MLLFCVVLLGVFFPGTLCCWSYICYSLALKKIILMWSVLASSIGTLLEYIPQFPPLKYGRTFLQKKLFMGDKPFWLNLWELFYMGRLMIALCKRRGSFTKAFSGNLNTINRKVFPKHGGIGFIPEVNS